MNDAKIILNERLKTLNCEKLPAWLPLRLLPMVEAEITKTNNKMQQQLHRRIARTITTKTIATAFLAGPPGDGEGPKGEGSTPPPLPTVK